MLNLPVGTEFFYEFNEKNLYYVDKTNLIKTILNKNDSDVIVITRPRRFGKTLTMSTFRDFLSLNPTNPKDVSYQQKLFKDTQILQDKDFCSKFMGKYPVIFITLKSVHGEYFEEAYQQLGSAVHKMAFQFRYLAESRHLDREDKELFQKLSNYDFVCNILNRNYIFDSLETMTQLLFKHHGVKPILLIDEYDVPIAHAASKKYFDKMISLLRKFLGNAVKSNDFLGKAILTGCLRVAKESIFTGLNNLDVYSVTNEADDEISSGIGFSKEETFKLLESFNLSNYQQLVINKYDGYYFGRSHIYCPWDIINFCAQNLKNAEKHQEDVKAEHYWLDTSGNTIVDEFLAAMGPDDINKLQNLISGKSIIVPIRNTLSYSDLKNHDSSDLWTLLLYTGYLTFNPKHHSNVVSEYELYIPNDEIKSCFKSKIKDYLKSFPPIQSYTTNIVKGLFLGNENIVQKNINKLLTRYISINDLSSTDPNDNYYIGVLHSIFDKFGTTVTERIFNFDTPEGYAEFILRSPDENTVVIIRVKQINNSNEDKEEIATRALMQIISKKSGEYWNGKKDVKAIFGFGICFRNKACAAVSEKLKKNNSHSGGASLLDLIFWLFSWIGIRK